MRKSRLKPSWEIEFYVDSKGNAPFWNWLSKLDVSIRARILERVNRIYDGNFGDCKMITKSIHEMRLHFGAGYRVYFGKIESKIVLLLCGGNKADQRKDIEKSVVYWEDYMEKKQ